MLKRWIALVGVAVLLAGCAEPPSQPREPWNGGVWNSVLGYVGPYNVIDDGHSR